MSSFFFVCVCVCVCVCVFVGDVAFSEYYVLECLECTIHHPIKLNAERCKMVDASRRHGNSEAGESIGLK